MRNSQKLAPKIQIGLGTKNAIIFISAGLGAFALLFMLIFLAINLGRNNSSLATGTIGSVKNGLWHYGSTWNVNRRPAHQDAIIISANQEVTISTNVQLNNVTIKVYGTLKFQNGRMRLNENSSVLIGAEGKIQSGMASDLLQIGDVNWVGHNITAITAPIQLTAAGESDYNLLPIELAYFRAEKTYNNSVSLGWSTVTEKNNDFFSLERSFDGQYFKEIATIEGAGNSIEQQSYQYEDKNAAHGINFYRLKQTDFDGYFEYFPIISINTLTVTSAPEEQFKIIKTGPNPFHETIDLTYFTTSHDPLEFVIQNINGKVLYRKLLLNEPGENRYTYNNAGQLAPGVYILHLTKNGRSEAVKMIKN